LEKNISLREEITKIKIRLAELEKKGFRLKTP